MHYAIHNLRLRQMRFVSNGCIYGCTDISPFTKNGTSVTLLRVLRHACLSSSNLKFSAANSVDSLNDGTTRRSMLDILQRFLVLHIIS